MYELFNPLHPNISMHIQKVTLMCDSGVML